jgi:hypothetical protein
MKVIFYEIKTDNCHNFQRYAEISKLKTKATTNAALCYLGVLLQILTFTSLE